MGNQLPTVLELTLPEVNLFNVWSYLWTSMAGIRFIPKTGSVCADHFVDPRTGFLCEHFGIRYLAYPEEFYGHVWIAAFPRAFLLLPQENGT